jgi:fatty acid desaturase
MEYAEVETGSGSDWKKVLDRDEIRDLLEPRDWRSWASIALNWGIVIACFALVARWPNPLTIVVALFVIAGRQLSCAAIMHDASHRALFGDRRLNDWAGNWLAAYPVWSDTDRYRPYHMQHHSKTASPEDPDLGLITPFPITARSLRRKVWRDLSGKTGWKFAKASWKRTFARMQKDEAARRAAIGTLVSNLVLLAAATLLGSPALYLLWVAAWLTTYTLVTRIRAIAEHAMTPAAFSPDQPLRNTRTMLARWWERLLVAPNRLNYHLEHHLLMTVPHYNLPRLHALLAARGVLADACVERSYWRILRRAAGARGAATAAASPPGGNLPWAPPREGEPVDAAARGREVA